MLEKTCSSCGKKFQVRFTFQIAKTPTTTKYFCSIKCREPAISEKTERVCNYCKKSTSINSIGQVLTIDKQTFYFCNLDCRTGYLKKIKEENTRPKKVIRKIAVLNQKGGTGKTTTSINLAAGLAEKGKKVLLVDMDPQGNVGASLGVNWQRSMYNILVNSEEIESCIVPIRKNLDVIVSAESLARAEIEMIKKDCSEKVLDIRMRDFNDADFIIIDCAPSISLINQNALIFADEVLITVSCDFLSLIGLNQILRNIDTIKRQYNKSIKITGILPTFYDVRNSISLDTMQKLKEKFGSNVLTPIRINTKLREAPIYRKTIFEYAKDSNGAIDYRALVKSVMT